MTESELRNDVARRAETYVGRNEADGSHRPIIDRYNMIEPLPWGYRMSYDDPWCAAFVGAVALDLGLTDIIFPQCNCEAMIGLYKQAGRWVEDDDYVPQVGDLVMYDWQAEDGECTGEADHVGIVNCVIPGEFSIIEGNCSDTVCCRRIPRGWKFIRGFCCPDYASKAEEGTKRRAKDEGDEGDDSETVIVPGRLPVLARGDKGPSVLAMQGILIALGYDIGPDGADGDFGANTEAALMKLQSDRGIEADGVCGPQSWGEMLGVTR